MTNKNKGSAKKDKGNGSVTADKSEAAVDKSESSYDKCESSYDKSKTFDDKGETTDDKGETFDDKDETTDDKGKTFDCKDETTDDKDKSSDDKDKTFDDKDETTDDKGGATVGKGIPKENKDYPLKEFYKKIYGRYDLVNRIFTFGQDRNWRKKAVEECLGNAPRQVLDICTGTGDLVLEMAEKAARTGDSTAANSANVAAHEKEPTAKKPSEENAKGKVPIEKGSSEKDTQAKAPSATATPTPIHLTGYDFSPEMLEEARKKASDAGQKIEFIEGNVAEMPFADNRFDTVGITFGIRNLIYENSNADRHLAEIHRVLRMNGRLVVLESSKPDSRIWRFFNGIYLQFILPWLGGLISGNLKAYRYLAKSSKNYYSRKEMAALLEQAGFCVIRSRALFFGSVMLLVAEKKGKNTMLFPPST